MKKIRHWAWWFSSSSQQRGLWGLSLTCIFTLAQGGSHAINRVAVAAAKSRQLCPTLWDPVDGSPPGSLIPGILQARTLEWVAISFSNARKWKVKVKSLSRVQLFTTPWTVAHKAPPSMGFSMQEYWSGLHFLLWINTVIPQYVLWGRLLPHLGLTLLNLQIPLLYLNCTHSWEIDNLLNPWG